MSRLKCLLTGNAAAGEKIFLSTVIGFTYAFTFLLFGMLDIFLNNILNFPVRLSDVLFAVLIGFFPVWIVISGVLFLLPGRFFTVVVSLAVGVLIAVYLQGNILNLLLPLGPLTGDSIPWHEYTIHTIINATLWLLIILTPPLVCYFVSSKTWKKIVYIVCIFITGMQGAALGSAYISNAYMLRENAEYYLSREDAFEVSSENNIMVFVIDRLDYLYIDAIRESDPAFFNRLDGFTDFTNATTTHEATFPSATYMTTGVDYDYVKSRMEYFDYAWSNSDFIPMLRNANYTMKYHMTKGFVYSDENRLKGIADNLREGVVEATLVSVVRSFARLSLYRFSPMAIKPVFWRPYVAFDMTMHIENYVSDNDPLFMQLLTENGLSLQDTGNNYFYLHLDGAHSPFTMDENGIYIGESDLVNQTKGCFNILYRYMDEMKRLGVYENATIIIIADHSRESLNIGFFVKPRGSASTPLVQNNAPVSTANLLPTILHSEGFEYSSFGVSAFDVEQDTDGVRLAMRYSASGNEVEIYHIIGDARDGNNVILVDSRDFLMDLVTGLPVN
jgi:hypothetical protein